MDRLLDNEREWRRYAIEKLDSLDRRVFMIEAWNLVFRLSGTAVMALMYIIFEWKLNRQ